MIKLKILVHVVQIFSRKYMNVYYIYDFLYEKDEDNRLIQQKPTRCLNCRILIYFENEGKET